MEVRPQTVDEILALHDDPVVAANDLGLITYINQAFTDLYGWTLDDLAGKQLTIIMPEKFREAHQFGFSRFLTTEQARITGKPLPLEVLFKDGTVKLAEHFILADKKDDAWRFAATIIQREP
jgi:PAS domain S-box-containing protein